MRYLTRLIGGPASRDTPLRVAIKEMASSAANNPLFFSKVLIRKISALRKLPPLPVRKRFNNVEFEFDIGAFWGTRHMYYGSYALYVVRAMKRFLRPGDIFVDAGANIGYLSAIAAGFVGKGGQVHSFEPVPAYFQRLLKLARLNPAYRIVANSCALGDTEGTALIQLTPQIGENTMVPGLKASNQVVNTIEVPVLRLDSYLRQNNLRKISLLKIDVQGFEMPILKGFLDSLPDQQTRPPIICEILPAAYPLLGYRLRDLARYLKGHGYQACSIRDFSKNIDLSRLRRTEDLLLMPA